jgi:hypothetical protein
MERDSPPRELRISVPRPSLARTAAEENRMVAWPAFFARITAVKMVPPLPFHPGLGTPPSNEMVPWLFENAGSSTQIGKREPFRETEITSTVSLGNCTTPLALLIATPPELTLASTVKMSDTLTWVAEDERVSVAADASAGRSAMSAAKAKTLE